MKQRYLFSILLFCLPVLFYSIPARSQTNLWQPTSGPYGGEVRAVGVHPTSPEIMLATVEGTLYRSVNSGRLWTKDTGVPSYVIALLIAPSQPVSYYVGTPSGIYKSTDEDATWTPILSAYVYSLATDPSNALRLFAGADSGRVYESSDGGRSWVQHVTGSAGRIASLAVSPQSPRVVYAGSDGSSDDEFQGDGIFLSADGGATWSRSSFPSVRIGSIVVDPLNPLNVYVGTSGGFLSPGIGIYRSADGGQTWDPMNAGIPDLTSVVSLLINPLQPQQLLAGLYQGLFKTETDGSRWFPVDAGLSEGNVLTLAVSPSTPQVFLVGGRFGLFEGTWSGGELSLIGVKPVSIESVIVDPTDSARLYAIGAGVYRSTDAGHTWVLINRGLERGHVIAIDPTDPDVLYAGVYSPDGAVYGTTNGGLLWTPTSLIDVAINDIVIAPSNRNVIYAGGLEDAFVGGMFRSTDAGATWDTLSRHFRSDAVSCLAVDPTDPMMVYAGTMKSGVHKTIDGGTSWVPASSGLPSPSQWFGYINDVVIDTQHVGTLLVATYGAGVYKTTDGGSSWGSANVGLTNLDVRSLVIDSLSNNVYAGTFGGGVFLSTDSGHTWSVMDEGRDSGTALSLALDAHGHTLYATSGGGVWSYGLSPSPSLIDEDADLGRPGSHILFQNYPNPFNPETTIGYALPEAADIRLIVYDLTGRAARTLVDGHQQPGRHVVMWDGRDEEGREVASGVYLYRLEVVERGFVEATRMILMR